MRHSNRSDRGRKGRRGRSSTHSSKPSPTAVFEAALFETALFDGALFDGTPIDARLPGESDRKPFDPGTDRKTLQLCRQVERAISLALAGQADDRLRDLTVDGVEPMGSPGHLAVRVIVPTGMSVIDILASLDARSKALRAEVAASICRKRVPALSFIPIAPAAPGRSEVPRE